MKMALHTRKVVQPRRSLPRSLRLRLLLWYGSLLAVALGFFALLFLLLTTGAINTSVNSAVRTEARVAMLDVLDDLSAAPPYWRSGQLTMRVVDTYRDPGVVVEVLDTRARCAISRRVVRVFPSAMRQQAHRWLASPLCCTIRWWKGSMCV